MKDKIMEMIEDTLKGTSGNSGSYKDRNGCLVHIYEVSSTVSKDFGLDDYEYIKNSNSKEFLEILSSKFDKEFTNINIMALTASQNNFILPTIVIKFVIIENAVEVSKKLISDISTGTIFEFIEESADEFIERYCDDEADKTESVTIKSYIHSDLSDVDTDLIKEYIGKHKSIYGHDPDDRCRFDSDTFKTFVEIIVINLRIGEPSTKYKYYHDVELDVTFNIIDVDKIIDFIDDGIYSYVSQMISNIDPKNADKEVSISLLTNFDDKFKSVPNFLMMSLFGERIGKMLDSNGDNISQCFHVSVSTFYTNKETREKTGHANGLDIRLSKISSIWDIRWR